MWSISVYVNSQFGQVGEGSVPTCIGKHTYQHLYEVRTCPKILKFFTKKHSTAKHSPHSSLVHKVETESLVLFSSVRKGKKLKRARSRKRFLPVENFTQVSTKSSNCCSLAAPSPAALISPMFPLWLSAPPNPGKPLQFIKLQWDRSSKLLPGNKPRRVSFYIIF